MLGKIGLAAEVLQLLYASDASWQRKIGENTLIVDGRTLHPRAQGYLALTERVANPAVQWTPQSMRARFDMGCRVFGGQKLSMARVENRHVPLPGRTLVARLYHPPRMASSPPSIIYFHGGGFVIGSLEGYDRLCRRLATALGGPVLSVDYRLAPEHPLPAAFHDANDLWHWLHANGQALGFAPARTAVCGDSAGAALAIGVCDFALTSNMTPPLALGAIYPPDGRDEGEPETASREALLDRNVLLTRDLLRWFERLAAPDSRLIPKARTLKLEHFPPTKLLTCGFDPLRDEGVGIHRDLISAGVRAEHREFPGMFHGFVTLGGLFDEAAEVAADIADFVNDGDRSLSRAPSS